jgi:hypothetical protein
VLPFAGNTPKSSGAAAARSMGISAAPFIRTAQRLPVVYAEAQDAGGKQWDGPTPAAGAASRRRRSASGVTHLRLSASA